MCRRGTGLFFARDEMGARVEALGRLGFENLCFFVDFGTMAADLVAETIRSLAAAAQDAPVVSMRERLG